MIFSLIFLCVLILLILPLTARRAHAKGGGSRTVDATGPKSENLQNLENMFYSAVTPLLSAYSGVQGAPVNTGSPPASNGKTAPMTNSQRKVYNALDMADLLGNRGGSVQGGPAQGGSVQGGSVQGGSVQGEPGYATIEPWLRDGSGYQPYISIPQPYDNSTLMGQLFNDATKKTFLSNARYDELLGQSPGILDQMADALNQSKTAGDKYFNQADSAYANAAKYLTQGEGYLKQAGTAGDEWYAKAGNAADTASSSLNYSRDINQFYGDVAQDQLTRAQRLANTGEIPEAIAAALRAETDRGLKGSIGSSLASLASRGVLNSSVTNKGVADLSQAAGDSYNRNYLNAFNTVLGGYQGNAGTAASTGAQLADTALNVNRDALGLAESLSRIGSGRTSDLLNVAQGYQNYSSQAGQNANSLMGAGSQRINDWLNISQGYGGLHGANLAEREQLLGAIPRYYENAAAPMMPAYDFLKTMLEDHWNSDKKDTIVKQGK